ncbi:MAG: DUF4340 domain-containing protein [Oscillospiraceae bacterium]
MKKNIKLIIIICAVVAVLAGLLIFLKLTAPEEEEETAAEEEVKTSLLYDKDPYDISSVKIQNEHGEYEIVRIGEGENSLWTIMDIVNLPMNNTTLSTLIENASTLTAQQTVVENAEDISIYGLDTPAATVTATFTDSSNTVKTLIIGNLAPDGIKRYLMLEGDPNVYTVYNTAVSCFLNDKYDVVNKTIYTARASSSESDTTDYTRINKMTIKRPDIDYDIVIEYDVRLDDESLMVANSSSYVISEPVFRDLNPEKSSIVMDGIFGLSARELAIVNPNENDMEACGLTEPAAEITVEINGGDTLHFVIGNEFINEDGKKDGRYVYADGISIIYIFDESSLPWLDVMPLEIVTTMFTSNYIYDLTALDIICEGKELNFTMTGSSADDFAVKLNGSDTDTDLFKDLYQFILRAPSSELYFEETTAEPILTINVKTASGGDLIEFIPDENRQTVIRLNGKSTYKCAAAYADRLIKNLELYEKGEDIVTNW